ncbi:hypothetical protein [Streptomyces sp. NBC_00690]|uniref:hypothetical protein n=1 Tax=Streptomyces sp. NBC_00690 TaxID=2975808 RepID=UPI002E2E3B1F|nr:hypothetical protein [Streptomyces sp. NBC_00690]
MHSSAPTHHPFAPARGGRTAAIVIVVFLVVVVGIYTLTLAGVPLPGAIELAVSVLGVILMACGAVKATRARRSDTSVPEGLC